MLRQARHDVLFYSFCLPTLFLPHTHPHFMPNALNSPALRSWIDIRPESDFPIQNLPFGVFETEERGPRLAVAIGGYVLDLYAASQFGFFEDLTELGGAQPKVFRRRSLNAFLRLGRPAWRAVRQRVDCPQRESCREEENTIAFLWP